MDFYLRRRHGGRRTPSRLDVMTCLGGAEVNVLQVMLLSLAESNPHDRVEFWLLHLGLAPEKLTKPKAFCDSLSNLCLHLVQVPDHENSVFVQQIGWAAFRCAIPVVCCASSSSIRSAAGHFLGPS
nr:hypothetical protein [Paracoccus saliphilus]